jgi:hypothetical protein
LHLAKGGLISNESNNADIIDAFASTVPQVLGVVDRVNLVTGFDYAFTPVFPNLYKVSVIVIGTATQPSPFAGSNVEVDLSYNDTFGRQDAPDIVSAVTNDGPGGVIYPIFAISDPISVFTSFTTFAVPGSILPVSWFVAATTGGTGSVAYGATITQTSTGAHAIFYGYISIGGTSPSMVYGPVTGVDDGSVWHSGTATLTPTASPTAGTGFFGPGSGVEAIQGGTGAFALQLNIPTGAGTTLYVGPHVSGVPDIPSGIVRVAGPAPNATNAWIDQVNGGVLIPTSAPILQTFSYNLHVRIEESL